MIAPIHIHKYSRLKKKKCNFYIYIFFLIWVLWPFQEYFTYIELIILQRRAKTGDLGKNGEPGEKKPDNLKAKLGLPTWDLREA